MSSPSPLKVGSFLTLEPDGSLSIELHQSWLESYMLCPQKFWLSYGEPSLELSAPKPALSFGTAVHEAMRVRHTGGDLSKQEEAIQAHFLANPAEDGQPRNAGRAIEALRAYDSTYPIEDWTILGVEEEFSTELGSFEIEIP
jgi:hypothetical protein